MDRAQHKRFLDYREMHDYFGKNTKKLDATEFAAAEEEHRKLTEKGAARDDEEEERFAELEKLLLKD